MLKDIKKGLIIGISAGISMVLVGISYAAFLEITNVDSNTKLSSTMMNNLIGNVEYNNSQLIGVDQSRQVKTSERLLGKTYTNNTGKPIVVSVRLGLGSGSANTLVIGGVSVSASEDASGGSYDTLFGIVPDGTDYYVSNYNTLIYWNELR